MRREVRETAVADERYTVGTGVRDGVPWPWNVPDGTWTLDLFRTLPEDGNRYEVIGGRLQMSPSPGRKHQAVSINLVLQLGNWAKGTKSGEVYHAP